MIDDLEAMSQEILMAYHNAQGGGGRQGSKPQRIIFYRDGVSEGQFQTVLSEELPALRRAFASLGDGSYNPPVTYVVAQKRHNTRLFVEDPGRDGEGKNKDVRKERAGHEAVNSRINRPLLVSSHTHRFVVHWRLRVARLQRMTFFLCV